MARVIPIPEQGFAATARGPENLSITSLGYLLRFSGGELGPDRVPKVEPRQALGHRRAIIHCQFLHQALGMRNGRIIRVV